jgi:hypothetical protein
MRIDCATAIQKNTVFGAHALMIYRRSVSWKSNAKVKPSGADQSGWQCDMAWSWKIPFAGKNHHAQNLVVKYLQFHHGVFATPHRELGGQLCG